MSRLRLAAWLVAGAVICSAHAADKAPQRIPLWPEGAPGAMANGGDETVRITEQGEHVISNVHRPSVTVYLPEKNSSGAAVVVIPGGGHRELWTDHEGHAVAKFLNGQGVAAFVLYYRLERAPNSTYKIEEHALADLQRAMRLVRSHAAEWGVNPDKIGTMGFSAGGQLALLGAMRYDAGNAGAAAAIDKQSSRPDFAALIYPGSWPEIRFDANTPPMFLLAGSDDRPGVITVLTQIFTQLREAKVPAELHFYDGVPHGFGVRASNTGPVSQWPMQFVDWLKIRKIL
ncbi:MAG TPA: alpha/beta hydrolase [Steroidobacteraceae bacterium]|nr:alpha/beta hydrolase [Steroidobacteraceae bacterium]